MRIGFVADIHEDIISLREAFALLEKMKCDSVVCLGDIVGFALPFYKNIESRDANECIKIIKENSYTTVAGNHDLYAIKKIPEYKAGFDYPEDWYNLDYKTRSKLAKNKIWLYEDCELPFKLTEQSAEYLDLLPEFAINHFDEINFFFSHSYYPDLSGSTIFFPKKPKHLIEHFNFMNSHNCLIGFSGHGHIEGCVILNKTKLEINKFGTYQLPKINQWIVGPCVANTTRVNGVMIFDTKSFQLDIISLKSPKKFI